MNFYLVLAMSIWSGILPKPYSSSMKVELNRMRIPKIKIRVLVRAIEKTPKSLGFV